MDRRFGYCNNIVLLFFWISVLGACASPIRHVKATLTAESHMVVPTRVVLPTPYARLIAPQFNPDQRVPMQVIAVVEYRDIPSTHYLWVVVRIPKVIPQWLVYPQIADGIPHQLIGTGTFSTTIGLGTDADSGQLFNLVVLLLNADANRSFVEYVALCQSKHMCGGIPLPDSGITILDFNTVIRE